MCCNFKVDILIFIAIKSKNDNRKLTSLNNTMYLFSSTVYGVYIFFLN